jgi:hypothetical protein
LLGLFVALVVLSISIRRTTTWVCPYCRATKTQALFFVIPFPANIDESVVTRYWKRHVDRRHAHLWVCDYRNEALVAPGRHSDCFPEYKYPILALPEDTELAVLSALRTPRERKRFVELTFCSGATRYDSLNAAMLDLRVAYDENPRRKDWPELLKKHHLWPQP